jgi:hypothetical protein
MLAFLTAGCGACVEAVAGIQRILEQTEGPLAALIVWEPVPGSGFGEAAPTAATWALLRDRRARQIWDPQHLLSAEISQAEKVQPSHIPLGHLRTGKSDDGILYDTMVLYAPGGRWERTLPSPAYAGGGVSAVLQKTQERLRAFH